MFLPEQVFFEPTSLDYPIGERLYDHFKTTKIPVYMTSEHNRITAFRTLKQKDAFMASKRTLVVGVRRSGSFQTCKPSAHYQLPLVTGCPGFCEYCYLSTTMGPKSYIRLYVNLDQIFEIAQRLIANRSGQTTVFEGAATSDPIPVEAYTGALARAITFFGEQQSARFRFVTKFDEVSSLCPLPHRGHTEIRFSLNPKSVIQRYEHATASLDRRLMAASQVMHAGYPVGFLIAPVLVYPGWKEQYAELIDRVRSQLGNAQVSFELVTHRYTHRARQHILSVYPHTKLEMDDAARRFKYGQFGYGKYVYLPETMTEIQSFLTNQIQTALPAAKILYMV
ncbi:MAG: spore photoproduct lyase [Solirubrobacterales bacterium]